MSKRILWGTRSEHHFAYAASDMVAGEVILYLEGIPTEVATRYSVQIGMSAHLAPTEAGPDECPWIYTNHSCCPNAKVSGRNLVAIRDIKAGEEINFDYETTEFEMAEPFQCLCGSSECRKSIRGYKFLDLETRRRLRSSTADYLLDVEESVPAEIGS